MKDEDWRSEEDKLIDLHVENLSLEEEVIRRGGSFGLKNENLDPKIENEFLKNIIDFEEAADAPQIPIKTLFNSCIFPHVNELTPEELSQKLDEIINVFNENNMYVEFAGDVPADVVYKFLVEEYIPNKMMNSMMVPGMNFVIDGCSGVCEECFQEKYCKVAQELKKDSK
jgi:hypothetical protein